MTGRLLTKEVESEILWHGIELRIPTDWEKKGGGKLNLEKNYV